MSNEHGDCDCCNESANESNEMNRRTFIAAAAVVGVVGFTGMNPALTQAAEATETIDAGPLASAAKDGIDATHAKSKFVLIRVDGKLVASSNICTHKGCAVTPQGKGADQTLFCKCHKSIFSLQGTPTEGPARRSLPRYAISKDDKGHVIVDKSKQFAEKEWEDPASFIKLES